MNPILDSKRAKSFCGRFSLSQLCLLWLPAAAGAAEIKVAAAADLTFAFKDVAGRFQKQTGNSIKLTYGSSGNFFAQIENGAPFDLFFSADVGYPEKLEAAGLAEPGTIYEYASGKIVMWVPNASKLDLEPRSCDAARSGYPKDRDRQPAACAVRGRGGCGDAPRGGL